MAPHAKPADLARALLDGFERHFARMAAAGRSAQGLFERRGFDALRQLQVDRIDWYDARVSECVAALRASFGAELLSEVHWGQVKLEYIGLLLDHRQPDLAEVFFNSVTTRVLERRYFQNRFMFVRPTVSTAFLDLEEPSYRCYYPASHGLRSTLAQVVSDFRLSVPFADLPRDVGLVVRALRKALPRPLVIEPNFQLQVLDALLFRGEEAYVVGLALNGLTQVPFVVPIVFDEAGRLVLDGVILEAGVIGSLFSSTRHYFIADIDVPATWVAFLQRLLPNKPAWELYALLGFGKASKALFYRDFLHHLRHSKDLFDLAPGTAGLVMLVFALPSFPYVFKVIRDKAKPPKDVDPKTVKERYHFVKRSVRAGRMADTLEYADVPFPKARLSKALLDELRAEVPSLLGEDSDTVILKHLYIERRLKPLDLYLKTVSGEALEAVVDDFGRCLQELAASNVFAGDLLYKNFGVTRLGRVVFYDYDEIEPVTSMSFRQVPTPSFDEDETRGEAWFSVGPRDVFPEEWRPFLYTTPQVQAALEKTHPGLFTARHWNEVKDGLLAGSPPKVAPYPKRVCFVRGAGRRSA